MKPAIVLTIAGSDCSGGAGVQADLKTIAAHGCYGTSVITSLTAQNTRGVAAIQTPPALFLQAQLKAVLTDFPPDAVKIGMLWHKASVKVVAQALQGLHCPIVLDPVMAATSGAALAGNGAAQATQALLFPLATLVTPNIPEAEALTGMRIITEADTETAARAMGCPVLIKGAHRRLRRGPAGTGAATNNAEEEGCNDLLFDGKTMLWLRGERLPVGETHGTGCTLSSAIACRLALGHSLPESARLSKSWLTWLLNEKPDFGVPNGPLLHR
ncbi:MAG: bifunctional hydroxymethylpyrimidine kinase/phosphomethylpyrimidine kinase [Oscillospiraceae bacterium]|jgi:hydroxymethylpyrimidine/phosphomethylpyrimidine kinase|nr:bifunctional hydroxymethylpyrimidine kinase/phosphomethylpyrimidine kinase [Oscillospiraceae bacterium]